MDGQVRVMFQVPGRALIGTGPGPYGAVMAMLSDITVVEVGSRISTAYCGKLLRDLGATVIKLEPLAGDALRSTEPGYAAFLHGGKRSVAAAAGQAAVAALDRLSGSADVIICDDDDRDRLDRVLSLRDQHPDLVVATISDYGLSGRRAGRRLISPCRRRQASACCTPPETARQSPRESNCPSCLVASPQRWEC